MTSTERAARTTRHEGVGRTGSVTPAVTTVVPEDDGALLAALRAGDDRAFAALVRRHGPTMLRVAATFVPTRAIAEEVVQETWLAVLRGLDGFRGDASLRTWIFRILVNRARTWGVRERRSLPFSAVGADTGTSPSVDPDRFHPAGHPWAGHWSIRPQPWSARPDERAEIGETLAVLGTALAALPPTQRTVVELRDVEGWTSTEVCAVLAISPANQRVLLHRGRSTLRRALEGHLADGGTP